MLVSTIRERTRDGLAVHSAGVRIAGRVAVCLLLLGAGCSKAGKDQATSADRPELALGRTAEYDYDPPEPGSYQLPAMMEAADGAVLDGDGREHSLRELLDGHVTVLSFVYTRCADPTACPLATAVLRSLHDISREDREVAANLRLVTFSFDPEFDDPKQMARFASRLGPEEGGAEWLFLTTSGRASLLPILAAYGQRVDPKKNPDDRLGPLSHNLRVFLIDRHGQVRNIYSSGLMDPRLVMTDVRTLLLEERG